jgi:hypothetical protein
MTAKDHAMPRLNDTDLVLLSAASQRDDLLITPPESLDETGRTRLARKLMRAEVGEEVPATSDAFVWRLTEEGDRLGLRILPAGLAALGIDSEGHASATTKAPTSKKRSSSKTRESRRPKAARPPAPRAHSKKAGIIALLRRKAGATLRELIGATDWLPHTTRAALTGLRKSGYELGKAKNKAGETVYRITSGPEFDEAGR